MSTLADQFHDTFEPYYSGKKTSWTNKTPQKTNVPMPKKSERQDGEPSKDAPEKRH